MTIMIVVNTINMGGQLDLVIIVFAPGVPHSGKAIEVLTVSKISNY
jgi:hypothetical protein